MLLETPSKIAEKDAAEIPDQEIVFDPKGIYTVNEFIRGAKTGRTKAYEEIGSGRLQTFKLGRKRLISGRSILDWVSQLESEEHLKQTVGGGFHAQSSR